MDEAALKPQDIKKLESDIQQEYVERTVDKPVEVVLEGSRPSIKVPVQVAIRRDVQVSDLPAVWLFAFGNLTVEEYNNYLKEHAKDLTINEMTASKVLEGVLKGSTEDKQIYWRLQEKIISKPAAVANKTNLTDIRPNAIMSKLLDDIEKNVFENKTNETQEAEVIENPNKCD